MRESPVAKFKEIVTFIEQMELNKEVAENKKIEILEVLIHRLLELVPFLLRPIYLEYHTSNAQGYAEEKFSKYEEKGILLFETVPKKPLMQYSIWLLESKKLLRVNTLKDETRYGVPPD